MIKPLTSVYTESTFITNLLTLEVLSAERLTVTTRQFPVSSEIKKSPRGSDC